jgi:hypothetical protein
VKIKGLPPRRRLPRLQPRLRQQCLHPRLLANFHIWMKADPHMMLY